MKVSAGDLFDSVCPPTRTLHGHGGAPYVRAASKIELPATHVLLNGSVQAGGGVTRLGSSTHLYNAMISPLLNHTIKGAVWYQV